MKKLFILYIFIILVFNGCTLTSNFFSSDKWTSTMASISENNSYKIRLQECEGILKYLGYPIVGPLILEESIKKFQEDEGMVIDGKISSKLIKKLRYCYNEKEKERRSKWPIRITSRIKNKKICLGMTKEQVRLSWGRPDDINRTVGSWGTHEQWIYRRGEYKSQYLYFENDYVTSWQD